MTSESLFLLLSLFALAACVPQNYRKQERNSDFIPFVDFMKQVGDAKWEDYSGDGTSVASEPDFQDMKAHILDMYSGVTSPVTSFLLNGQYGDCIPILEQPSASAFGITELAKPPTSFTLPKTNKRQSPSNSSESVATFPLTLGWKDAFGNDISCPENTVPFARITLEKMTSFPTLREFFARDPQKQGSAKQKRQIMARAGHLHAIGYQEKDNYGGSSFLNVWDPVGPFSLSQQWYVAVTETNVQTVETGWQVAPTTWGTTDPVLFIYWTADNYTHTGCYNTACPGFVQTNSQYMFAEVLQPGTATDTNTGRTLGYSTASKPDIGITLEWQLYSGAWWFFINGHSIGYYPTEIYKGGQLSQYATQIQYGGEVDTSPGALWPPMGSGAFAQAGYGQAAYQNNIFYFDLDSSPVWADLQTLDQASTSCYTIEAGGQPNDGVWTSYIFFGGPGGRVC